jgi:hypothetical protein
MQQWNRIRRHVPVVAVVALMSAACKAATAPPVVLFRLNSASTTTTPVQQLVVSGAIDNRSDAIFRSGGCLRPEIVIDSLTPAGSWVDLGTTQSDDLATCVTAFNVSPGRVQSFQTTFMRSNPPAAFPRGVALRLRTIPISLGDAPAIRFALP